MGFLFIFSYPQFLSTPSAGRATGDLNGQRVALTNFYPRPPRGERQQDIKSIRLSVQFLSTPSAGRATPRPARPSQGGAISIHALRGESDSISAFTRSAARYFYPRPPRGERQDGWLYNMRSTGFLSTPSAGRATAKVHKNPVQLLRKGYNHFPAGRRNPLRGGKTAASTFNNLAAKC